MTKENQESQWIHFEAGAISKSNDNSIVIPYLVDMEPTDLQGPLTKFHSTHANEEGTKKLINGIKSRLTTSKVTEEITEKLFNAFWKDLNKIILESIKIKSEDSTPVRSDNELLREILQILRKQEQERNRFIVGGPYLPEAEVYMPYKGGLEFHGPQKKFEKEKTD